LDWGFREFGNFNLFVADEKITTVGVWLGEQSSIPLLAKEGILLSIERKHRKSLKVTIRHMEPIPAPIQKGSRLGVITVNIADRSPIQIPLIAGENVQRLGPSGRISETLGYLLWGASR
jgi:D-alanyl-D-alanine carboxypeptidase (penicillin-binding protein 5/6)